MNVLKVVLIVSSFLLREAFVGVEFQEIQNKQKPRLNSTFFKLEMTALKSIRSALLRLGFHAEWIVDNFNISLLTIDKVIDEAFVMLNSMQLAVNSWSRRNCW